MFCHEKLTPIRCIFCNINHRVACSTASNNTAQSTTKRCFKKCDNKYFSNIINILKHFRIAERPHILERKPPYLSVKKTPMRAPHVLSLSPEVNRHTAKSLRRQVMRKRVPKPRDDGHTSLRRHDQRWRGGERTDRQPWRLADQYGEICPGRTLVLFLWLHKLWKSEIVTTGCHFVWMKEETFSELTRYVLRKTVLLTSHLVSSLPFLQHTNLRPLASECVKPWQNRKIQLRNIYHLVEISLHIHGNMAQRLAIRGASAAKEISSTFI